MRCVLRTSAKLWGAALALRFCSWRLPEFLALLRCHFRIENATGLSEQSFLYSSIQTLPNALPGDVVECGSYKGGTSAILSLACSKTHRKLHVFDSFCGLPAPTDFDSRHYLIAEPLSHVYQEGSWAGSLEEVRRNIQYYGDLSVCEFHRGFFDETMPEFNSPVALAFCDVDLRLSLETCIRYLWPLLSDGAMFFTHEAHHYEIASLFYDTDWWCTNLSCEPPGLVGAGGGMGLVRNERGFYGSCLGFTIKNPQQTSESVELDKQRRFERHLAV